jgi:hypothetical protein
MDFLFFPKGQEDIMTVIYIGDMNVPNYTALSSDINLDGTITRVSKKGRIVLLTDTGIWKVVLEDLTLADYALPISFNGSVDIGAVHLDQQLTESVKLSPNYDTRLVTVPGTAEQLKSTDVYAISLLVFPKSGNVGNVYFGTSGVDKVTSKQIIITPTTPYVGFDVPIGNKLNLSEFYVDADNGNDGVYFMYIG